jgi:hypothetical protein
MCGKLVPWRCGDNAQSTASVSPAPLKNANACKHQKKPSRALNLALRRIMEFPAPRLSALHAKSSQVWAADTLDRVAPRFPQWR